MSLDDVEQGCADRRRLQVGFARVQKDEGQRHGPDGTLQELRRRVAHRLDGSKHILAKRAEVAHKVGECFRVAIRDKGRKGALETFPCLDCGVRGRQLPDTVVQKT